MLLSEEPKLGRLYRAAALRRSAHSTLSDRTLALEGVRVDRAHLAAYDRVCGFRLSDTLPPTYPHVLAFPLAMALMTDPSFPFPLLGLVHLANRITVRRALLASETFALSVQAADLRPHERGSVVDVIATASVDGSVVWTGCSSYLHRTVKRSDRADRSDSNEPPVPTAVWRVPRRVGADYAQASGDRNPIHTNRLLARALGFRSTIAHGMWTKARCLAALEGRLPEAHTASVAFRAPIVLPSTVGYAVIAHRDEGWSIAVHDRRTGKPHLTGSVG